MTHGLVIPRHLVKEMELIKENTGVSIRKQIMQAIEAHIDDREKQNIGYDKISLTFKQVGERVHRLFNTKTGRFHNAELGIDVVH